MIVIDYSGVAIAAITGFREDLKQDEEKIADLIRHVILSSIKTHKKRFKKEYGDEVVLAIDSAPYWRKKLFPHYKFKRKKNREESDIPWDLIYKYMDLTLQDIREHFPWKVVAVPGAEADDVMAVMATDIATRGTNDLLDTGNNVKKIVIVSSDKDLKQLMTHPNIRVWSPYTEKYAVLEHSPKEFLRRLILTGDSGDGIPNCFSASDCFVTGTRQTPCTEKKMAPLLEATNMAGAAPTEEIKNRIIENAKLISFAFIPPSIKDAIIEEYEQPIKGNKMSILKYLISKNMKRMLDDVDHF